MDARPFPAIAAPVRTLALAATLGVTVQLLFVAAPAFAAQLSGLTSDKLMHALVFGALALLAWIAFGGRSLAIPFGLALGVGALHEATQWMLPGREPSFADLLADGAGAAAALAIVRGRATFSARKRGPAPVPVSAVPISQGG
jgi:hypothetical protein